MKKILSALVVGSMLLLTGCATMFGDNNKVIHVDSHPHDAQIYANNNPVGTTPASIAVPSTWSPTLLTFKKKGYVTQTAQVNTSFQPIGLLNLLFWPGFVIDAISGNMMKISPESRAINVAMPKA